MSVIVARQHTYKHTSLHNIQAWLSLNLQWAKDKHNVKGVFVTEDTLPP